MPEVLFVCLKQTQVQAGSSGNESWVGGVDKEKLMLEEGLVGPLSGSVCLYKWVIFMCKVRRWKNFKVPSRLCGSDSSLWGLSGPFRGFSAPSSPREIHSACPSLSPKKK